MVLGVDFWKDFGGFCETKWSQFGTNIGSLIDLNFERPILQKNTTKHMKSYWFVGFWGRSWGPKSIKVDQDIEATRAGIWASIFDRFWWFLGAKLGGKGEPKSIKKTSGSDEKNKGTSMAKSRNLSRLQRWAPPIQTRRRRGKTLPWRKEGMGLRPHRLP